MRGGWEGLEMRGEGWRVGGPHTGIKISKRSPCKGNVLRICSTAVFFSVTSHPGNRGALFVQCFPGVPIDCRPGCLADAPSALLVCRHRIAANMQGSDKQQQDIAPERKTLKVSVLSWKSDRTRLKLTHGNGFCTKSRPGRGSS